jgi:multidrug efflux pump subunit AcrA (membrane-fusion protein)
MDSKMSKQRLRLLMAHLRWTASFMLAACLVILAACGKSADQSEKTAAAPVQIASAARASIQNIITADAVLYPFNQSTITPKVSAPVKQFFVHRGDRVSQGQLLATLENRDLAAAALEGKAMYDQAKANYQATTEASLPEELTKSKQDVQASKQAVDTAERQLESRQTLFKQGALARKMVEDAQVLAAQARSQYETALEHLNALQNVGKQQQIRAALAQVEAAHARYQGAEAQLGYSEIRSPISGVIADRPLYAGEMASAGSPLLTVMDVSKVVARANVPQNEASNLKIGDSATVSLPNGTGDSTGKVIVVSPAADPNSTTVQVWVQVPNPGGKLKPGTSVRTSIVAGTLNDALLIPTAALLSSDEGGESVFTVGPDSIAHEHKVEVGIRHGDQLQILSGLSAGDRVVTIGGLGLEDGAKVQIEKAEAAGGESAAEK